MGKRQLSATALRRLREERRQREALRRIERDASRKDRLRSLLGARLYHMICDAMLYGFEAKNAGDHKVAIQRDWWAWFGDDWVIKIEEEKRG